MRTNLKFYHNPISYPISHLKHVEIPPDFALHLAACKWEGEGAGGGHQRRVGSASRGGGKGCRQMFYSSSVGRWQRKNRDKNLGPAMIFCVLGFVSVYLMLLTKLVPTLINK